MERSRGTVAVGSPLNGKILAFAILLGCTSAASAQSVGLPAPRLLTVIPMGGKVGTEFEVSISGEHLDDVGDLIFEAPTKAAQAWFVKHLGPEVYLGNIPPDEVIPLETLRLGLRADTIKEVLLAEERAPTS